MSENLKQMPKDWQEMPVLWPTEMQSIYTVCTFGKTTQQVGACKHTDMSMLLC
jgi:hypothetical protein